MVPHDCLLVVELLFFVFALALVLHLLSKVVTHALLLVLDLVHLLLVGHPLAELLFQLVTLDLFLFLLGPVVHALDDRVGHPVHEVLRALFSGLYFVKSVLLLLVQHPGILLLAFNVLEALLLALSQCLDLVFLVFYQHLLQVFLLLLPFLRLKPALSLHFVLQALYKLNLVLVSLPLLLFPAMLLLLQLLVARGFFLHDASFDLGCLLCLLLFEKLYVLVLQVFILALLVELCLLALVLFLQLLIKLLLD